MRLGKTCGFIVLSLLLPFGARSQSAPTAAADDQSQTVLKANTRLVVVDVVVTDSKGVPVPGLESTDFTVLENGKPQKISHFSFQHPGTAPKVESHLPANVFTNVPAIKNSSLNVILLDALNGEYTSRAAALDQLIKYLGTGPDIQPTAVYLLEDKLKLLHDFTTDTKALKEILGSFRPRVAPRVDDVYTAASAFTQKGSLQTGDINIQATLRALNALAQSLAGYPGRKNLIWLSEAFPVDLFPDVMPSPSSIAAIKSPRVAGADVAAGPAIVQNSSPLSPIAGAQNGASSYSDYLSEIIKVADALMAAQVAVYPIDAAGVGRISRLEALTTMRNMAERTGGKTFANQNNLEVSIRSSMDDGSTYYTLAYYPEDKNWDGKFRQIEVKTDRSGVNLRYRLGYYAMDPEAESKQKEDAKKLGWEFTQALGLDTPSSTAILFHATVVAGGTGQPMIVRFAIDPHTLSYTEKENGVRQANLGCAIVAYTEKGSRVRDEMNNLVGRVKAEEFAKLMQSNFPCQCTIDLKPGKYKLRLGVVDKVSRQIGTTTADVTVQ